MNNWMTRDGSHTLLLFYRNKSPFQILLNHVSNITIFHNVLPLPPCALVCLSKTSISFLLMLSSCSSVLCPFGNNQDDEMLMSLTHISP